LQGFIHGLSEDVRMLTINFQEDASFIEGSLGSLIRNVDQALKNLQSAVASNSSQPPQHLMMDKKQPSSRNKNVKSND
jgi:hypothetical protein